VTFAIHPGAVAAPLDAAFTSLAKRRAADALWARRLDLWSADPAVQQKIANRLGWLDIVAGMTPHLPRLRTFAAAVRDSGVTDVVLLGMGGSSLAPEVLRAAIGAAPGYPRFQILDSVDPDAVRETFARAATTFFVLASKSGSTIEPNSMAAEAERLLRDAGITQPGTRFAAITDEGTSLHRRALAGGFSEVFVNPSDIGGRYSALSFFGLVPAALMGIDLDAFLDPAREMIQACREPDPRVNPGLALGAFMAAGAQAGRDKLTLLLPPHLERFGWWVEQLVAESTGKQGKGIVPIAGEAAGVPAGDDRLVVELGSEGRDEDVTPRFRIHVAGGMALGAEFFRWEMATAVAGVLLDINPFDEPNVQQAKDATGALLDTYKAQRRLPMVEPDAVVDGVRITLTAGARAVATNGLSFLGSLAPPDYFAFLAYIPPGDALFGRALLDLRESVAMKNGTATMLGYGPRYLHSTGQLHKGGPNTGVFVIVTVTPAPDLEIPGEAYSFGVLEQAQALGDFESLNRAGRRAAHVHLPARDPRLLEHAFAKLL
jgi:glucose-6-phosphate isomerase